MGQIDVYPATQVPADTDVLDAEADGLTESTLIENALLEASRADVSWNTTFISDERSSVGNESGNESSVTDGAPDDGVDDTPDHPRLATIQSEAMAATDEVENKIGFRDDTYVTYKNKTYILFYSETVC